MKKLIALMLMLVICFGLAACGGGGDKNTSSNDVSAPAPTQEAEPTPNIEPEPDPDTDQADASVEVKIGEAFTLGDFEFTINEWSYISIDEVRPISLRNLDPLHSTTSTDCVQVDFSIKYKGKTQLWGHTQEWYSVEYDDGFVFAGAGMYHGNHVTTSDGWDYVSVSTDFQPLSEPWECRWVFPIPSEVKTNTNAPFSFVINVDGVIGKLNLR